MGYNVYSKSIGGSMIQKNSIVENSSLAGVLRNLLIFIGVLICIILFVWLVSWLAAAATAPASDEESILLDGLTITLQANDEGNACRFHGNTNHPRFTYNLDFRLHAPCGQVEEEDFWNALLSRVHREQAFADTYHSIIGRLSNLPKGSSFFRNVISQATKGSPPPIAP